MLTNRCLTLTEVELKFTEIKVYHIAVLMLVLAMILWLSAKYWINNSEILYKMPCWISGTLNSGHYIPIVLQPMALPFIWILQNYMFQHNIAWLHVANTVQTFLNLENVRLLPWAACSPDLSPIENIWSIVVKQLTLHHTSVTTVDGQWHLVETV